MLAKPLKALPKSRPQVMSQLHRSNKKFGQLKRNREKKFLSKNGDDISHSDDINFY
jgi:hypothetical protein